MRATLSFTAAWRHGPRFYDKHEHRHANLLVQDSPTKTKASWSCALRPCTVKPALGTAQATPARHVESLMPGALRLLRIITADSYLVLGSMSSVMSSAACLLLHGAVDGEQPCICCKVLTAHRRQNKPKLHPSLKKNWATRPPEIADH